MQKIQVLYNISILSSLFDYHTTSRAGRQNKIFLHLFITHEEQSIGICTIAFPLSC